VTGLFINNGAVFMFPGGVTDRDRTGKRDLLSGNLIFMSFTRDSRTGVQSKNRKNLTLKVKKKAVPAPPQIFKLWRHPKGKKSRPLSL
jgi:hypothetical protein